MSASDSDLEALRGQGGIPTSPFEIQITKDALQRRLDNGDITREDIEVLKRSYRWMTISSAVGWATGIPVFFLLKRRVPPPPALVRIGAATAVSMTGSFLGFAAGGAAAALEVNKNMPDANRKLQVFQQIVIDSKRAISEHRAGIPTEDKLVRPGEADEGNAVSSSSPSSSKQDPGSSASSEASTSASGTGSSTGAPTPRGAISNTVNAATGSTWERLRTTRPAPPQADTPEEELHRQQAEFDAMIERERRGGDGLDRWK